MSSAFVGILVYSAAGIAGYLATQLVGQGSSAVHAHSIVAAWWCIAYASARTKFPRKSLIYFLALNSIAAAISLSERWIGPFSIPYWQAIFETTLLFIFGSLFFPSAIIFDHLVGHLIMFFRNFIKDRTRSH
jgi:hypothetical protein